jgi:UPF0755 protein
LGWLTITGLVGVAAAAGWLFVVYPSERGPSRGQDVEIVLEGTETPDDLTRILASSGLIATPRMFSLWVALTGGTSGMVKGEHLLTDDASPRELMARLERKPGGGNARVTFPEGWTRFDMAKRLQDKHIVSLRAFLDATTDPSLVAELGAQGESLEGYLFPATYDLPLDADARDVVRRMKGEFDKRWDTLAGPREITLRETMQSAALSSRDLVVLASMVEKEAAVDDERALIASVFLNRLRDPEFKPKLLQCDPTAAYGCLVAPEKAPSCAAFTGKPNAAIQHDPANVYSTYTHERLPPGPIANPGARSLEAVMAPASTHYFYFVARGEGRHTFSETFEAHHTAVQGAAKR